MKNPVKKKLLQSFNSNIELNKKANNLKKSWDEVEGLLKSVNKPKK
ncbi:hypothetical protein [Anaeromicropila herbilytica]|uniref:Uncharacterized protein n=1 Tax=Anaeromicropila herbilytica TaxID=2785025 RepID=A0A7R7EQ61_9FIRM|nr:hypothetical protein [Anaeromicropila herbilytica]BCN32998.1 hypothetical protein bsdtb5_42930 [Anaeromicropila herbilytica]